MAPAAVTAGGARANGGGGERVTAGDDGGGGAERQRAGGSAGAAAARVGGAPRPTTAAALPPRPGAGRARDRLMPLVLAINSLEEVQLERDALSGVADVHCTTTSDPKLASLLPHATAIVVLSLVDLPEEILAHLSPGMLAVCISEMEAEADRELAEELGLQCAHVGTELHREAAETAMALVLSLVRRTQTLSQAAALGGPLWAPTPLALQGCRRCAGMHMLLVMSGQGTGDIARELALRAKPFGFRVSYVEAHPDFAPSDWARDGAPEGVEQIKGGLLHAVAQADVVSMHCMLTERTGGFFGQACVDALRPGALLVSVCSAELFNDRALKRALLGGALGGVALDVAPAMAWGEAWLRDMSNLIITPQCSCFSDEAWRDLRLQVVDAIKGHLRSYSGLVDEDLASADGSRPTTATRDNGKARAPHRRGRGLAGDVGRGAAGGGGEGKPPTGRRRGKRRNRGGGKHKGGKGSSAEGGVTGEEGGSNESADARGPQEKAVAAPKRAPCPVPRSVGDLVQSAVVSVWPLDEEGNASNPLVVTRQAPGSQAPAAPGPWRCMQLPATAADPCCHFTLLRNIPAKCVGFRSAVADGRILQNAKNEELLFLQYHFRGWEMWECEDDAPLGDVVLTNKRWHTKMRVRIEVVAMPDESGIVRTLSNLAAAMAGTGDDAGAAGAEAGGPAARDAAEAEADGVTAAPAETDAGAATTAT